MSIRYRCVIALVVGLATMLGGCGCKVHPAGPGGEQTPPPPGGTSGRQAPPPVQTTAVRVHFVTGGRNALTVRQRDVPSTDLKTIVSGVVTILETETVDAKTTPAVPRGTKVLDVRLRDGTLTVNLSREYQTEGFWGGSAQEYVGVYSLVNSLCSLAGVERVQILVEGKTVESAGGHVDLTGPLAADESLVK